MPAIPPTSDFNKSTIDKDTFHAKFMALHAYLTGLLASSGNAADARSQLGLGSAATVNTGTASGNVPLVGTESATTTVAGLVLKSTTTENAAGTGTGVVAAADLPTAVAALSPSTLATASANGHMSAAYASKLDGIAAGATVGVPQDTGVSGIGTFAICLFTLAGSSIASAGTTSGANLSIMYFAGTALTSGYVPAGTWRNVSGRTLQQSNADSGLFQRIA